MLVGIAYVGLWKLQELIGSAILTMTVDEVNQYESPILKWHRCTELVGYRVNKVNEASHGVLIGSVCCKH